MTTSSRLRLDVLGTLVAFSLALSACGGGELPLTEGGETAGGLDSTSPDTPFETSAVISQQLMRLAGLGASRGHDDSVGGDARDTTGTEPDSWAGQGS